jgi:Uma2 family endonuclease
MATAPRHLISEQEYLHTTCRPDCDYVDGFVLQRNVGTPPYARLQGLILSFLMAHETEWSIQAIPECRLKIRDRRYRIPDVMVLPAEASRPELVIEEAPLLCIEVVSPKDRLANLVERAGDYLSLGYSHYLDL